MRIVICIFSGTGNTRLLAEEFGRALDALGHSVTELPLDGLEGAPLPERIARAVASCDLLGIAYPVHAFNAPSVILKFAKLLPHLGRTMPAFILKTSGEPLRLNDVSSLKLMKLLRRRGYEVRSEYHYCMPYNIIFRHSDGMAWRMLTTAEALIPLDARELVSGVLRPPRPMPGGELIAWLMRCEHWGGRLNGRFYSVTDKCVHCNMCVRQCPAGNIRVDEKGKIKFGGSCLMCMRCAQNCPQNAIRIGLFESWKINGPYAFQEPDPREPPQGYNKLLTAAYRQYFSKSQRRLSAAEESADRENSAI